MNRYCQICGDEEGTCSCRYMMPLDELSENSMDRMYDFIEDVSNRYLKKRNVSVCDLISRS
jgi:hypothetical protein